jgi:hypothetical protein
MSVPQHTRHGMTEREEELYSACAELVDAWEQFYEVLNFEDDNPYTARHRPSHPWARLLAAVKRSKAACHVYEHPEQYENT